jgi:hypothetical protein
MEANHRRPAVLKRAQVRLEAAASAAPRALPSGAAPEPAAHAPRVRLVRLDEHAQALEFTCACGEVSLIEIESEKKP